jgi:hypothetical protein
LGPCTISEFIHFLFILIAYSLAELLAISHPNIILTCLNILHLAVINYDEIHQLMLEISHEELYEFIPLLVSTIENFADTAH